VHLHWFAPRRNPREGYPRLRVKQKVQISFEKKGAPGRERARFRASEEDALRGMLDFLRQRCQSSCTTPARVRSDMMKLMVPLGQVRSRFV
jgi:hypothetical protein